jgi:hypothetical protein
MRQAPARYTHSENLRLAPSSGSLTLSSEALAGCSQRATPWIKVKNRQHPAMSRVRDVAGERPDDLGAGRSAGG